MTLQLQQTRSHLQAELFGEKARVFQKPHSSVHQLGPKLVSSQTKQIKKTRTKAH